MDLSRYKIQNLKLMAPTWQTVFTYLSLFLALFTTWISVFGTKSSHCELILAIALGTYVLVIAIVAVWREISYARKARYAEAMVKFHKCIHCLRDAFNAVKRKEEAYSMRCIEETLSFFASAFSLITGVHCRSCIKILDFMPGDSKEHNFYVAAFARGSTTLSESAQEPKPYYEKDWVDQNSDFMVLFRTKDNKFFSNDLSKEKGYRNSHWPTDPSELQEFLKNRKYDYISTIIWPIRNMHGSGDPPDINGFLCIDSKTRGVFCDRYDIDAGAILADALYFFLAEYRATFQNAKAK